MSLRVLIADDHPIVSAGVQMAIEPFGFEVVANITSVDEIISAIETHQPKVLVTEARLANADALKVLESLPDGFDANQVVVFSAHSHRSHVARASALGCHDFVSKSSDTSLLVDAVKGAAAGTDTPESSPLKTTRARMKQSSDADNPEHPLTGRELQVLRHVSMGLSNREVGKALGISVETVKEHVQNILRKLNVNDRTQAAVWAVRSGLI
jgi:DNA-binding NarL/FixJ family response regulator